MDYDLIVIGAGPGGYPAAIRASQLGLKTACIERELVGGVCLNWGCIPSKALLKTAELANKISHDAKKWGLGSPTMDIDYPKVIKRSRTVSKKFNKGVEHLFKKYGVHHLTGTATLAGKGQVSLTGADGTTQTLSAKNIVVATGAGPRTFPGIEPDGQAIFTYRDFIVREVQPASMIILGSGAIGMEFADFLNAMGTEVTVVEGLAEVLPREDPDCAAVVRTQMSKRGVRFELGQFVDKVDNTGSGCVVTLKDGKQLKADNVLVALGISPNTAGIGLDALGVKLDRGFIEVDHNLATNVPGIYAVGDCTTRGGLAHTATRQAHVCVERIAGHHAPDVDYDLIPSCTYCQPQVASVGLSEAEASKRGIAYKVGSFPFIANGKAVGGGHGEGFAKVLVGDELGEILGAHIVGSEATEMIADFAMAISSEATAESFVNTVHAHPTNSEVNMEAVAVALGVSVHI